MGTREVDLVLAVRACVRGADVGLDVEDGAPAEEARRRGLAAAGEGVHLRDGRVDDLEIAAVGDGEGEARVLRELEADERGRDGVEDDVPERVEDDVHRRAVRRVEGRAADHERLEALGAADVLGDLEALLPPADELDDPRRRPALVGHRPRDHLPHDDVEGVDVADEVRHGRVDHELGRHVGQRPDGLAARAALDLRLDDAQAEVAELHAAHLVQQQIQRLEVEVHDVVRVQKHQTAGDVVQDLQPPLQRQLRLRVER